MVKKTSAYSFVQHKMYTFDISSSNFEMLPYFDPFCHFGCPAVQSVMGPGFI